MKNHEVKVGVTYLVKLKGKLAPVRLETATQSGGWAGTNLETGRTVRIKSARRLRKEVKAG